MVQVKFENKQKKKLTHFTTALSHSTHDQDKPHRSLEISIFRLIFEVSFGDNS